MTLTCMKIVIYAHLIYNLFFDLHNISKFINYENSQYSLLCNTLISNLKNDNFDPNGFEDFFLITSNSSF